MGAWRSWLCIALLVGCGSRVVASDGETGTSTGAVPTHGSGSDSATEHSSGGTSSSPDSTTSMDTSSATDTPTLTGEPPDCEDNGGQWEGNAGADLGDWPPTGTDSYGNDAWDIDVACTYEGISPVPTGILLNCDDAGTPRQVDLRYSFWPQAFLPAMEVGDPLFLRVHTGIDENWIVLSGPTANIIVLHIVGTPEGTLADQSDYAPFEFSVLTDLCPVVDCIRQWGLDITVGAATTRVFEGAPVDVVAADDVPYQVTVTHLAESSNEIDPECESDGWISFAIRVKE